ncbi:hypothetical protein NHX12_019487 [Muraenolepis orangiensis]|uniref:Uncharacterized protein n=1 Tax=Muraenolepis orangiensis TaxID=630683 RepID=A0A9Q0ETF1_9TELE|nr:hypothetical protein NHX12_019487 [Muraenolepis orangiensis]
MEVSGGDAAAAANKTTTTTTHSDADHYRKCIGSVLKLLTDFGQELKLGEAVLKVEVNLDALDFPAFQKENVCNSLQQHISKLQAVSESLKTLAAAEQRSKELAWSQRLGVGGAAVPSEHKEETSARPRPPPLCHGGLARDDQQQQQEGAKRTLMTSSSGVRFAEPPSMKSPLISFWAKLTPQISVRSSDLLLLFMGTYSAANYL